jgi:hypothetical protein
MGVGCLENPPVSYQLLEGSVGRIEEKADNSYWQSYEALERVKLLETEVGLQKIVINNLVDRIETLKDGKADKVRGYVLDQLVNDIAQIKVEIIGLNGNWGAGSSFDNVDDAIEYLEKHR